MLYDCFSNVAKGEINIQSEPNKGKHHNNKDIQQAILTTIQPLNFSIKKTTRYHKMAKRQLPQNCLWLGIISLNQNVMDSVGVPLSYQDIKKLQYLLVTRGNLLKPITKHQK